MSFGSACPSLSLFSDNNNNNNGREKNYITIIGVLTQILHVVIFLDFWKQYVRVRVRVHTPHMAQSFAWTFFSCYKSKMNVLHPFSGCWCRVCMWFWRVYLMGPRAIINQFNWKPCTTYQIYMRNFIKKLMRIRMSLSKCVRVECTLYKLCFIVLCSCVINMSNEITARNW